jgi:hypothetical protein
MRKDKNKNKVPEEVLKQFLPKEKLEEEVQELEEIVTNESELD